VKLFNFFSTRGEIVLMASLFLFFFSISFSSASPFGYDTSISTTDGNTLICINGTAGNNISCVGPTGPMGPAGNGTFIITSINQTQMSNVSEVLNILESWLTTFVNGLDMFYQGTIGNTKGAIINRIDNHTQNSNNIIFAVVGNGSSNVMMPHFWIQNGGGGQASGVSRSFMIVNENPTQQNTSNITSCQNYANYAGFTLKIDCNTTTTGADLLVGDDAQFVGDMYTSNIYVSGNVSIKRPHAMYSSTQTQTVAVINTAYPVTFNWTEEQYLISKTSDNRNFSVQQNGSYLIELSAMAQSSAVGSIFYIWFEVNGVTVPRSNTLYTFKSNGANAVISVPAILELATTDRFSIKYAGDSTGITIPFFTNTSFAPSTPSIIMTISKISEYGLA